jgi:hypothetical protein
MVFSSTVASRVSSSASMGFVFVVVLVLVVVIFLFRDFFRCLSLSLACLSSIAEARKKICIVIVVVKGSPVLLLRTSIVFLLRVGGRVRRRKRVGKDVVVLEGADRKTPVAGGKHVGKIVNFRRHHVGALLNFFWRVLCCATKTFPVGVISSSTPWDELTSVPISSHCTVDRWEREGVRVVHFLSHLLMLMEIFIRLNSY